MAKTVLVAGAPAGIGNDVAKKLITEGYIAYAAVRRMEKKQGGSPVSVITREIMKAITAARPKTRYVAGKYSTFLLFVRKWFRDRTFDRVIGQMLR